MNLEDALNPTLLSGNREERKEVLQQTAEKSLKAIEAQLGDLKKTGTNALIIGGTIVAGYALTRAIMPEAENEKLITKLKKPLKLTSSDEEKESVFWGAIKGIAVSVALGVAKQKITDAVQNFTKKDAKPSA